MDDQESPIRLLIADDHPVTRGGLRALLADVPDIEVVGEATEGPEVKRKMTALVPDVLLLDLVMPHTQPFEIEAWVRENYPDTVTLILTAHDTDRYLAQTVESGAVGFITKDEDMDRLIEAIRRAAKGDVLLAGDQLGRARRWRTEVGERWARLTEREKEVLSLVAEGQATDQIAASLCIERSTVETHIGNVLQKLDASSRIEAVVWALRHDLVEGLDRPGECARPEPGENAR